MERNINIGFPVESVLDSGKFVLIALAVIAPVLFPESIIKTWTVYLIFTIFALSVDLIWGYTGILTFGHAAFLGAGAYFAGKVLISLPSIPDVLVVLLLAPAFAGLIAFVVGWFNFRSGVVGDYFTIVTLIIALAFEKLALDLAGFLGGFTGLSGIPSLSVFGMYTFSTTSAYYLVVVFLLITYLSIQYILSTSFGLVLWGIRENEERTVFFGYDTIKYRIIVFTLSGLIAGLAGSLYAVTNQFVSPSLAGVALSTSVIIWLAVGGKGTLTGAVLGALLIQSLSSNLSDLLVDYWQVMVAVVFIFIVIWEPDGIMGKFNEWKTELKGE